MSVLTERPAPAAQADAGPAELGFDLGDPGAESLAALRASSDSALALALQRVAEEGKTRAVASAGFSNFHPKDRQ